MGKAELIAVQCSDRHMTIWLLDETRQVLSEIVGAKLQTGGQAAFEASVVAALGDGIAVDAALPVICSGHPNGGRIAVPASLQVSDDIAIAATDASQLDGIIFLPGLSQTNPASLLGAEATAIAGFLSANEKFDGVVLCAMSDQSSWVHISAQEAVSFRNFMTPSLARASWRSFAIPDADEAKFDTDPAFLSAVDDAMARPAAIAAEIASLRAESVLALRPCNTIMARLHGLLIGAELAAARPYWLGQQVVVIGDEDWVARYIAALSAQGLEAVDLSDKALALAGLCAANARINAEKER